MIKEHLVSASVTNGAECICNPEILLGTKYGMWDFENELAPKGALMDLNAAWELFLSRQDFSNVSFDSHEHHQHEVIDGVVYEEGDITYILKDENGNPTGASFTIKANKGPVEHIEWEKGKLYLYYTKQRPLEDKDLLSGAPIHYVKDEDGTIVIDEETGKPLIYDYVTIPVLEIFDNDETRLLFPWYSDDNNVVHLRDSIDGRTGHLGSFSITPESEVYYSKEVDSEKNQDLISLQSVLKQLNTDLGFEPKYVAANEYPDPDDNQYHDFRAQGSNLLEVLHEGFGDKTSLVKAINEDLIRTRINTRLLADAIVESDLDWSNILEFADDIKNNAFRNSTIPNVLAALNWILTAEIGPFKEELNSSISKVVDGQRTTAENITEALNIIFEEAENSKDRIGYDRIHNQWIELNTDEKDNLTSAINEVDQHNDALTEQVGLVERWDTVHKKTYYENPDLNNITKNRLRLGSVKKDDVKIVESINELQSQIGNLSSSKSGDSSMQLSTDYKHNVVGAINEVDLHADNNSEVIGAEYLVDIEGKKTGNITNLGTNDKSSIVSAINELDTRVGELDDLDTEDKTNIVNAINETIKEAPFIYEDIDDPESGVILKDLSQDQSGINHAGKYSLSIGTSNDITDYSIANGSENISQGHYTIISGDKNTSKKKFSIVNGKSNFNDGNYNLVNGLSNTVNGSNNTVSGSNNVVTSENSVILGDNIYARNSINIIAAGDTINVKDNVKDAIALGKNSKINGDSSVAIGVSNFVSEESVAIGHNNETEGPGNVAIGDNNYIGCDNSYTFGNQNITEGNHSYTVGEGNHITGHYNTAIGNNQIVEGGGNVVINAKNRVRANNSIVVGDMTNIHDGATHIGGDIYINTHESETKAQGLMFVNLNDWCKANHAAALNGEKFLDTQHLINAIKAYKRKEYSDDALLRFTMQENNENGLIIMQGKSTRVYLYGTWYYTDNIENGWSRKEGEYLRIVEKETVNALGNTVIKHYLTFMDLNTTEAIIDTTGAQRSNSEDFKNIDLTHAYGAIDIDDFENALDLVNKLNKKVDKTAQIITKYRNSDGSIEDRPLNFVNTNNPNLSKNIVLDLEDSFGFNADNYQLRGEKGEPNGYVPLNAGGLIDAQFLPSFVDDVIEVWAEYLVESPSGAIIDIHLYKLETLVVPTTGQEIFVRGQEILEGEPGKIYIESNPSSLRRFATQFRWSGHQFTAIGFTNITIGEVEGTAYDGGKGKVLRDEFDDHKHSGTTQIPIENSDGTTTWVTYKPNPHNVTADLIDVIVNDPNDNRNINLDEQYTVEYTIGQAIKTLFNRINKTEDESGALSNIIASQEDLDALDALDNIEGNDAPTMVQLLLETKEKIDSVDTIEDDSLEDLVGTYFNLDGD